MTAVLHAIADCGDVVDNWDITHRDDGVLLRVRSRVRYPSEEAAGEAAGPIARRIRPNGFHVRFHRQETRSAGGSSQGWHAVVEVLIT